MLTKYELDRRLEMDAVELPENTAPMADSRIEKNDSLTRRLRRKRRNVLNGNRPASGWSVSLW